MDNDIKEILDMFTKYKDNWYSVEYILKPKQCVILLEYITNLQEENTELKKLADKYEEEHNNEFQCWKRDRKELLDKKARIDKVIEYIQNKIEESKNLQDYSKWYVENYDKAIDLTNSSHGGIMLETIKSTTIKRYEDILNILKGE